jgi:NAD-dependent SIR2 family protein deacetylase
MKKKYAIFLGAGASAADGAPLQSNLFKEYFKMIKEKQYIDTTMRKMLRKLFLLMFDIDVIKEPLEDVKFPSFEEVLGILDLAYLRNESFKEFSNINVQENSGGILFLRLYLVFLMDDILSESLGVTFKGPHRDLIGQLKNLRLLQNTIFITSNYDILCDNAIRSKAENLIDYGVTFSTDNGYLDLRQNENRIKLYKLHGSLNWLHCPTCNTLVLTPGEKAVNQLFGRHSYLLRCSDCDTVYSPIIVPPTFFKDMSKVFLSTVWNKAETDLLKADHLIFCGYSFPDADMHIKYLIKRIQKNRQNPKKLKISVINNHANKTESEKNNEKDRYIRFLGKNVDYTDYSFEEFAENPKLVMT